jgi:hypothetical protein
LLHTLLRRRVVSSSPHAPVVAQNARVVFEITLDVNIVRRSLVSPMDDDDIIRIAVLFSQLDTHGRGEIGAP